MRVVAGELRGRKLVAPDNESTRPTTDKVREAVFNALGSLDVIIDARVVDVFAGTGAAGIEALSRGAVHCTFIERERDALSAINENIANLGLGDRTRVVRGDALAMIGGVAADLAFVDPPYDFTAWDTLLERITVPFVVAEAGHEIAAPAGWETVRARSYRRTWVTFLQRVDDLRAGQRAGDD